MPQVHFEHEVSTKNPGKEIHNADRDRLINHAGLRSQNAVKKGLGFSDRLKYIKKSLRRRKLTIRRHRMKLTRVLTRSGIII